MQNNMIISITYVAGFILPPRSATDGERTDMSLAKTCSSSFQCTLHLLADQAIRNTGKLTKRKLNPDAIQVIILNQVRLFHQQIVKSLKITTTKAKMECISTLTQNISKHWKASQYSTLQIHEELPPPLDGAGCYKAVELKIQANWIKLHDHRICPSWT